MVMVINPTHPQPTLSIGYDFSICRSFGSVVTKGIKQQQSLVVRNFAVNCNMDAISKTEHLNEVAYIGEWISRTYEPWCPPEMDPPWPLMAAAGPTKEHELLPPGRPTAARLLARRDELRPREQRRAGTPARRRGHGRAALARRRVPSTVFAHFAGGGALSAGRRTRLRLERRRLGQIGFFYLFCAGPWRTILTAAQIIANFQINFKHRMGRWLPLASPQSSPHSLLAVSC